MFLKKRIISNHFIVYVRKNDAVRFQTERYVVKAFSIPVVLYTKTRINPYRAIFVTKNKRSNEDAKY